MRRTRHRTAQEPSLVPLADMLTNTVGIMLFILAFTLLATGGATLAKRLPMEEDTDTKPIFFLCLPDRLLPVDFGSIERLPQPPRRRMDLDDARDFIRRGDGAEVSDEFFTVRQSVKLIYDNWQPSEIRAFGEFIPKDDVGLAVADFGKTNQFFAEALRTNNPTERFLYFLVRPDAMKVFCNARELGARKGYKSGWGPLGPKDNVRANIIGKGGNVAKPDN